MILFSEDTLLEEAAFRIIRDFNSSLQIQSKMGLRGFSYFQKRVNSIIRSSKENRFLIMLDADCLGSTCLPMFIEKNFGNTKPENIIIRFAVQEVENWLISDQENLHKFLRVSRGKLSVLGDNLQNAKEYIVDVCRSSRSREVKEDIVPARNHSSKVGPAYNDRLSEFIRHYWNPKNAMVNSDSLRRAISEISAI